MAAFVVLAGDRCEARVPVGARRAQHRRGPRVVPAQAGGDSLEHPSARKVEAVEVRQLAVGLVGHDRRRERERRAHGRQEAAEPLREAPLRQHPPHQVRLGEARREEVLAARLEREVPAAVVAVEGFGARDEQLLELAIADGSRPVEHQPHGERGLAVLSRPDRVAELGKPRDQPFARRLAQRRQRRGPRARVRVVPAAELGVELQQPGEAVGALERPATLGHQIGDLGCDVLLGQRAAQGSARGASERCIGIHARQPREQPVAVDRRVPVEAAEERRRQRTGRGDVRLGLQHVADLVGELAVDAVERQLREARRGLGRELRGLLGADADDRGQRGQHQAGCYSHDRWVRSRSRSWPHAASASGPAESRILASMPSALTRCTISTMRGRGGDR